MLEDSLIEVNGDISQFILNVLKKYNFNFQYSILVINFRLCKVGSAAKCDSRGKIHFVEI